MKYTQNSPSFCSHPVIRCAVGILASCMLLACSVTVGPDQGELTLIGSYTDSWGTHHTITDATWTESASWGTSIYHIYDYSNDDRYIIAQNDMDNAFGADLWSKFEWYDDGTDLWYCQTEYQAASETEALNNATSSTFDVANSGCGNSGWTNLTSN